MSVMDSFCRKQKKTPKGGGQLVMGVMSGKHNALERAFPKVGSMVTSRISTYSDPQPGACLP